MMVLAKFYCAAGNYTFYRELDLQKAMLFFQKALELFNLCKDINTKCEVLICMAQVKYSVGDYCTAQMYATEAQKLSKLSPNLFQEARTLQIGAWCSRNFGDFKESMTQLHRSREILSTCGLSGGYIDHGLVVDQAETYLLKSEYAQARSIYHQIVETTSTDHNAVFYAVSLLNIAQIDVKVGGDAEGIYQKLNKAKDIFRSYAHVPEIVFCDMCQADMELREKKFEMAKSKFLKSGGIDNQVRSFCFEKLADIRAWPISEGQFKWPVIYCGDSYKSKDKLALHKALLFLGDVFTANKDKKTATSLYLVALQGFTHMDVHHSRGQCMMRLGDLADGEGHTSKALFFWKAARPLFELSLQAKDVAQIDLRLAAAENAHQNTLLGCAAPVDLVENTEEVAGANHEESEDNLLAVAM
jgi:tetratricopeptide (TPR) repeat protein